MAEPECLTCELVTLLNETEHEVNLWLRGYVRRSKNAPLPRVLTPRGCLRNDAHFSTNFSFWTCDCQGPVDIPQVFLVNSSSNARMRLLQNNSELNETLDKLNMPIVRTLNHINIPGTSYQATVRLYIPPDVNFHTFATYPLIVEV